jgi:4-carboxymuconolactone decarboxylase
MAEGTQGRTARVPLVEPDSVPAEHRDRYDHVGAVRGGHMPDAFRAMAHSPHAMERIAGVGEYLRFDSGLDPALRELVTLVVTQKTGCALEWTAHWGLAVKAGVPEDLLARLGSPEAEKEPEPLGSALRFARQVTDGDEVDDETIAVLRAELGDKSLIDLVTLVGYYLALSRIIETLQVPLPAGIVPQPYNVS